MKDATIQRCIRCHQTDAIMHGVLPMLICRACVHFVSIYPDGSVAWGDLRVRDAGDGKVHLSKGAIR